MHRPALWRSGSWSWLLLAALLLVTTRARADDEPSHPTGPERAAPEVPLHEAASALRALLERAGVPAAVQGFTETLSPADARRLLDALMSNRPTLGTFGPRQVLLRLLHEVAASPRGVALTALGARVRRFEPLVIARPDGYFAGALSGQAIQPAGRVYLDPATGVLRAGPLEVGAFYIKRLGNLYRVDDQLEPVGGIVAEVQMEHGLGPVDAVLDGVEGSLAGMVWGIAELIREPIRSAEALLHLPQAVVALIESSPEYWARFVAMPRGDQIREVSRLVTDLALLCGSVKGVQAGLDAAGGVGSQALRVLRVTGSGELVVTTAGVPVGKVVTVLGGGPGTVLILQMAGSRLPQEGSGADGAQRGQATTAQEKPGARAEEGGAAEGGPEEWVPPDGWQGPTEGKWLGRRGNSRFEPKDPEKLGLKPGDTIEFRRGQPDFSPWSQGEFDVPEMNGEHDFDLPIIRQRIAQQKGWLKADGTPNASAAQRWLKEQELSPHHAGGMKVQLIPTKLHGHISHTGGAAELRKFRQGR